MPESLDYDGSQIEPLWAYSRGIQGNSIVVFRGAMDILDANVKDLEDLKNKKAIRGGDMLHFIVERFDSPASMRLAYFMQRMLVVCAKDVLRRHGIESKREGDDLFVGTGKLTVSIATAGISSEKVHFGINISCEGTPPDVRVACLDPLGIKDVMGLAGEIATAFTVEMDDIESDMVKTRSL
ncbi:MAG: DUF366 family protein [ANME-2 cluster archaeon]|nr:DUF366 family protein [ANME-2 cluster archaeon]MDF1556718.1 DUF366 family protein [ANME-2 cluster archaeon]